MPASVIEVVAPSRLHFGMFAFGRAGERQFGGVGAMIDSPGLRLRIAPAERVGVSGPLAQRALGVAEKFMQARGLAALPHCQIEITSGPPEHMGLGTGTQLALAVVAGLNMFLGGDELSPAALAALAGRGARSAIGTYGFCHGGLLVESGKLPDEALAPLEQRRELPPAWRFVLIGPHGERGLSGDAERYAFADLPPVSGEVTTSLRREVLAEMLPAAAAGEFDRFSRSLYRYGHEAGMCFAARQGGPFASPRIAALIDDMRSLGIEGVGQSSWGPTVFALLDSPAAAADFTRRVSALLQPGDTQLIAVPNHHGATITRGAPT